ncbi:hypothetical protein P6144_03845 [Sphingomonas sp. HITSZ_GF]|uniref:hypothetical protein n=1 Tax=Sphingomonas sp. HITSZ_GF TaxID=3037247 RepID=UPI00240CFE83|nr:hypothetical protein [Sphingomonas sp. HITSZ_GF]MDG2532766.1 hypothetical protein [Sphingomonas sp. HITSZ_GF]
MRAFHLALLPMLAAATACGGAPAATKHYPAPVPAAELTRLLPGHYVDWGLLAPCDSGPLVFQAGGRFLWYNGFGNATGTYRVLNGGVEMDGKWGGRPDRFRIRFARDAKGALLFAMPENPLRPVRLAPVDAGTPGIGCGAPPTP